jgi:hypothetical protein
MSSLPTRFCVLCVVWYEQGEVSGNLFANIQIEKVGDE